MHSTTNHQAGASVSADSLHLPEAAIPQRRQLSLIDPQKAQSPGATGLYAEPIKTTNERILAPDESAVNYAGHTFDRGEFRILRDRFEKRGYALQRVYRADDGRVSYHIMRSSKICVLSHPHDVRAFLTVVEADAP